MTETKVVSIGSFRIGIIHGHQIVPWGDLEALAAVQRELDCDILVSGHTHKHFIHVHDGKYFINPGSATGAYSALSSSNQPSFILMAIQGEDVSAFVYTMKGEEMNVSRIDFSKNGEILQDARAGEEEETQ